MVGNVVYLVIGKFDKSESDVENGFISNRLFKRREKKLNMN